MKSLPSVFLSCSGKDIKFANRVYAQLPPGLGYFYPKSFENGEQLISAMEARIGQVTVFALIASAESAKSPWVNFEISQARIATITKKDFRILVFPIDFEVTRESLPRWMSDFWIPSAGQSPRDVARYIRGVLYRSDFDAGRTGAVFGRGALLDAAIQKNTASIIERNFTPNVFFLAGVNGIGRRTFCREFLKAAFPALPELSFGPQITLHNFADLPDIYRFVKQEVSPYADTHMLEDDLRFFQSLSYAEKTSHICKYLDYFAELGQAVVLTTGTGFFEDNGFLKNWASILFDDIRSHSNLKLCIIANRQIHEREISRFINVIQISVPPLKEIDIKSVMVSFFNTSDTPVQIPSQDILNAIGGHPEVAKMSSRIIAQKGLRLFEKDPRDFFGIQNEILSQTFDPKSMSPIENEILSLLSWVPQLGGDIIESIILERHSIQYEAFADVIGSLIMGCLVEISGDNYSISSALRAFFRREFGYGASDLRKAFAKKLSERWQLAKTNLELQVELIDAVAFMAALEGGTLPTEFRAIILPATIQGIVKDLYDGGRDNNDALQRVIDWALLSNGLVMDESTREEIQSFFIRACIRLGRDPEASSAIADMEKRGYRSIYYLRAFFLKRRGRTKEAIVELIEAKKLRKYRFAVIVELAECYKQLAMWTDLRELLKDNGDMIERNPALLDTYIGLLIAERKYAVAESKIAELARLPNEDGRAESRRALVLMRRDGDFRTATDLLTNLLPKVRIGRDSILRSRGMAAAQAGYIDLARQDAQLLHSKPHGESAAWRINIFIYLYLKDYPQAFAELSKISH